MRMIIYCFLYLRMSAKIFEDIRDGNDKNAKIVFQNEDITAFQDINPDALVHVLIIPNKTIASLNEVVEEDSKYLSQILLGAREIARQLGIDKTGYRLINNCGKDGGQEIDYLHFHLVGGLKLGRMISLPKESKKIMKENSV